MYLYENNFDCMYTYQTISVIIPNTLDYMVVLLNTIIPL